MENHEMTNQHPVKMFQIIFGLALACLMNACADEASPSVVASPVADASPTTADGALNEPVGGRNVGGRPARRGPPPDLLGRVVQKMPLRHFGRLSEEISSPLSILLYLEKR